MPAGATFINIIEVAPDRQQEVIDVLKEGTERVYLKQPGLISITLLASTDGRRVINLARWESPESVKAAASSPEAAEYVKRTAALAAATPGLYQTAAEYTA